MTENILNGKTAPAVLNRVIPGLFSKPVFSIIFALLLCISANSFVYLPFTPVPITMQVLTVLLSAVMLGRYWALASQIQYIAMGILGLPVFAGFKSGLAALAGPTGGYIAGFIAGSFITGCIYDKYRERNMLIYNQAQQKISCISFSQKPGLSALIPSAALFLACISGLAVIYISGCFHLMGFLYLSGKSSSSILHTFIEAIKIGVLPFIIADMFKIAIILNLYKIKDSHEKN